jgi:hypothetical protein
MHTRFYSSNPDFVDAIFENSSGKKNKREVQLARLSGPDDINGTRSN